MFIVPKYRYTTDGRLEFNDLNCDGIEHKMGYKASPVAQLSMGDENDCHGYLVGEPNQGLSYMFQMMNEARINVGTGAAGKMTAAYYAALEYAQQRCQGRSAADKRVDSPQIPIIEHADVKRMLLFQRAIAEGSYALCLQASHYVDLIQAVWILKEMSFYLAY
jgi:butyryl-CoA dehydrogenase